jgi:hypothetical protein
MLVYQRVHIRDSRLINDHLWRLSWPMIRHERWRGVLCHDVVQGPASGDCLAADLQLALAKDGIYE